MQAGAEAAQQGVFLDIAHAVVKNSHLHGIGQQAFAADVELIEFPQRGLQCVEARCAATHRDGALWKRHLDRTQIRHLSGVALAMARQRKRRQQFADFLRTLWQMTAFGLQRWLHRMQVPGDQQADAETLNRVRRRGLQRALQAFSLRRAKLPQARQRKQGDVDLLIDAFLESINADARGKPEAQDKKISLDARKILISYPWPGNIRELYHSLLRASIWSVGEEIMPDDVRSALLQVQSHTENVMGRALTQGFDLQALLDEISSDYILRALKQTGDRKTTAAHLLGFTNHQTLSNWMKRLDLDPEENKK